MNKSKEAKIYNFMIKVTHKNNKTKKILNKSITAKAGRPGYRLFQ
jgi:hypothetical protein